MLYTDETIRADDRAFLLKVQDTVRAAVDEAMFGRVVDAMRDAAGARMNTDDIPGVVRLASKDYGLGEHEEAGILNRLIECRDYTLYGLANAVTRHSQDTENYDSATELEPIGYEMINMERQRWNRLNSETAALSA
jgi:hypothetical protein